MIKTNGEWEKRKLMGKFGKNKIKLLQKKEKHKEKTGALKKSSKVLKVGFTFKLLAICIIPMIMVALIIESLSVRSLEKAVEKQIESALKIVATSVNETYTSLYKGDYKVDNSGKLYKGDESISGVGKTKLIDAINEETGFHLSMVYNGMRLITTLKKDNGAGRRINGSYVEEELNARIVNGEDIFLRNEEIDGVSYYLYYKPLINSDNAYVGAIEVATPSESVKKIAQESTVLLLIISLLLTVAVVVVVFLIARKMGTAMISIQKFLNTIKAGRLDAEPEKAMEKRKDELGDVYRTSIELQKSLLDIVNNIVQAANGLTSSAEVLSLVAGNTQTTVEEVVGATEQIAERASSQAVDAKVTSQGVMEMNERIKEIKRDMHNLVTYAESMAVAEQKNREIVDELNAQSSQTRKSLDDVTSQIDRMNKSVQSIGQAVTLISDIADETDLLSLNASIEAARAGEAGRGFAVVAEQIKKLADQSNISAKEISLVIREVVEVSKETADIMQKVYDAMNGQQNKLDETKAQSEQVSSGVEKSIEGISSISTKVDALRETSRDIKDSVITLADISEKTRQTADGTIETVSSMSDTMAALLESSDKLNVLANNLNSSLGVFRI